jgi:tRNA (mo5U34)-methyltransferase
MSTAAYENIEGKSAEDLQEIVDKHYWHHSIDFGNGVVSKGNGKLPFIEALGGALYDGLDLSSKSLLDIGAWNGAFSFEAKRRGCARVLASDKYCWTNHVFKGREAFELARAITGLDIEAREIDVPDIDPATIGTFDAVLFAGVFYHLLTPVHLTQRIAECARHVLIIETHQDFLESEKPGMVFYPGQTLYGDGSNWWGPNPHAMYEMLKEFGFAKVFYQDSPEYDKPSLPTFRKRGIYHAFRTEQSLMLMGAQQYRGWTDLDNPEMRAKIFQSIALPSEEPAPVVVTLEELSLALETQRADLSLKLEVERATNLALSEEIRALRRSTSWKITAPMRAAAGALKGSR